MLETLQVFTEQVQVDKCHMLSEVRPNCQQKCYQKILSKLK